MNILIFDQSEDVRRTIGERVNRLGSSVNISSVESISSAKYELSANSFDLIIIDVDNLKGHFLEIVRYAKAGSPQASIILLSMKNKNLNDDVFIRSGADYHINSLFRLEEFIDVMQEVAKRYLSESYGHKKFSKAN